MRHKGVLWTFLLLLRKEDSGIHLDVLNQPVWCKSLQVFFKVHVLIKCSVKPRSVEMH